MVYTCKISRSSAGELTDSVETGGQTDTTDRIILPGIKQSVTTDHVRPVRVSVCNGRRQRVVLMYINLYSPKIR